MEMEAIITILSVLVPTLSSIASLGYWLGRRFGKVDERFKQINEEFERMSKRLDGVEGRLVELKEYVDGRFEEMKKYVDDRFGELKGYVDGRLGEFKEYVDGGFEGLRKYVDGRLGELKGYVEGRFDELEECVDVRIERLGRAFSSHQEFFVEYLSVKGIVSADEATMLKNEAARLSTLATTNPFTKEEWEKLKMYLERDPKDFTLKEAEDFRELGRKASAEYWDKPEAHKLHMYTCVVYGLALRRMEEEKERKKSKARRTS
jgi:hypothetical protein